MKHTLGRILLFIIGIGILGGIAQFMYERLGPSNEYQAVLLTTGDVYFAKVSDGFGHYLTLRDIYYPQVNQAEGVQSPDIQLIKFGNEIHRPQSEIKVNREHVIMIQPLSPDSPVISTIESDTAK
ncbi:MAG: hypothetical protein KBD16_03680 [Candidatus Pacebacteria bacterium]|nr:hypothetical protein [Candidatus Paceibacterota bacterium]